MKERGMERLSEVNNKTVPKLLLALLFLSAVVAPISLAFGVDSEDAAASVIDGAESVLASAYEDVLTAEQAGANVSVLLVELNNAGELLTEARLANRSGDFDQVANLAGLCSQIGETVKSDAVELRLKAESEKFSMLFFTLIGSLVGVVAVVIAGFFGWGYIRKRYVRKVLEMKPEVSEVDEH